MRRASPSPQSAPRRRPRTLRGAGVRAELLAGGLGVLVLLLSAPALAQSLRGQIDGTPAVADPDPLGIDASGDYAQAPDDDAQSVPKLRSTPARQGRVTAAGPSATPIAQRVGPVAATQPTGRDPNERATEEAEQMDPSYGPVGLRTGSMTWFPALELGAGYKSNVDSTAGGRSSTNLYLSPELIGRSDWSRHALEIRFKGAWDGYPQASDQSQSQFETGLRGRVDVSDLTRADVSAGVSRQRESVSSMEAASSGAGTDIQTATGSLGITRDFSAAALTLRGDVTRTDYYANGTLGLGVTDPSINDNTLFVGALRATIGPGHSIAPFVEGQLLTRRYDQSSVSGYDRDTSGGAIKVGIAADAGPTLRGEISTGWSTEKPVDSSLEAISGWVIDADLAWSPTRLVVVRAKARTQVDPTTAGSSPGAIDRSAQIEAEWMVRRNVSLLLGAGIEDKRYEGVDVDERTGSLSAGLSYKWNRNLQSFVRGRWDHVTATGAEAYGVGTVMTGIRIQR